MMLIALLVASVFLALALLHVYWAIGGIWGIDAVIPTLPLKPGAPRGVGMAQPRAFNPGPRMTLAVAVGLALVALLVALDAGLLGKPVLHWPLKWTIGLVAILVLARAVGDFRLVGFFKTVTGSRFARLDTWIYSPLCVLLGIGLGLIAVG